MLWSPQQRLFIDEQYNSDRIVTLQLRGSVFFGSSMTVLSNILDEAGVPASVDEQAEISKANSPLPHRRVNSVRIPSSLSPSMVSPGSGSLSKRRKGRSQQQPKKKQLIMLSNKRTQVQQHYTIIRPCLQFDQGLDFLASIRRDHFFCTWQLNIPYQTQQ